jgi:membrane-bound lytic murein transglycosylase B
MARLSDNKKKELVNQVSDAQSDWMAASTNKAGVGPRNINYWVKGIPPKHPKRDEIGEAFYNELIKTVDRVAKKFGVPVKDVVVQLDKKAFK